MGHPRAEVPYSHCASGLEANPCRLRKRARLEQANAHVERLGATARFEQLARSEPRDPRQIRRGDERGASELQHVAQRGCVPLPFGKHRIDELHIGRCPSADSLEQREARTKQVELQPHIDSRHDEQRSPSAGRHVQLCRASLEVARDADAQPGRRGNELDHRESDRQPAPQTRRSMRDDERCRGGKQRGEHQEPTRGTSAGEPCQKMDEIEEAVPKREAT